LFCFVIISIFNTLLEFGKNFRCPSCFFFHPGFFDGKFKKLQWKEKKVVWQGVIETETKGAIETIIIEEIHTEMMIDDTIKKTTEGTIEMIEVLIIIP
jgi:hypothetical protein